jgi:hypothetical protein
MGHSIENHLADRAHAFRALGLGFPVHRERQAIDRLPAALSGRDAVALAQAAEQNAERKTRAKSYHRQSTRLDETTRREPRIAGAASEPVRPR